MSTQKESGPSWGPREAHTLLNKDVPRVDGPVKVSGRAVYAWNERDGIVSLREGDVRVPGSMRIIEALRHISASIHFGVYVFRGLPALLQYSNWRGHCMALLRQIARGQGKAGNIRKIVLVEQRAHFGDALDALIERIADDPNPPKKI